MTPEQIKGARHDLGLTTAQLGQMLDIKDERTMRKHMQPVESAQHKQPSPRMVRLLKAYLAGYRPDDWPK